MISIEDAKKRISGLDGAEIRKLTKNRLLGIDSTPFGSGHSLEPSEDLVIQLLSDPNLDEDTRKAVIMGCKDVYANLLAWLGSPDYEENVATWQDVVIRISRLVDVAAPMELMGHANSVLAVALVEGKNVPEILGAAIRACMAYKDKSMLAMWKQIVDKYPDVAAYAFNALLKIEPISPEVEGYLKTLWRRQVVDNWPVDTAFLMRRSARLKGEEDLIYRTILILRKEGYWKKVERKLREKPWSAEWLKKFPDWKLSRDLGYVEKEIRATRQVGKMVKSTYAGLGPPSYGEGLGKGAYYQFLVWKSEYTDIISQDLIKKHIFERYETKISSESEREDIYLLEEIPNV